MTKRGCTASGIRAAIGFLLLAGTAFGYEDAGFLLFTPSPDFSEALVSLELKTPSGKKEALYRLPISGSRPGAAEPQLWEVSAGETSAMMSCPSGFMAGRTAQVAVVVASANRNTVKVSVGIDGGDVHGTTGFLRLDGSGASMSVGFPQGLANRIEQNSYQRGGTLSFTPGIDAREVRLKLTLMTQAESPEPKTWRIPIQAPQP